MKLQITRLQNLARPLRAHPPEHAIRGGPSRGELAPKGLARFREEARARRDGQRDVRKAMAILQSVLSFAVAEELIESRLLRRARCPFTPRAATPARWLLSSPERSSSVPRRSTPNSLWGSLGRGHPHTRTRLSEQAPRGCRAQQCGVAILIVRSEGKDPRRAPVCGATCGCREPVATARERPQYR